MVQAEFVKTAASDEARSVVELGNSEDEIDLLDND